MVRWFGADETGDIATRMLAMQTTLPLPTPAGPGWFDSSFELAFGLVVTERFADDVPLSAWIGRYLRGSSLSLPAAPDARSLSAR